MKKIAIIGTGISGLTCAYSLAPHYQIELFEANDYIGGHTHTVDVEWQGEKSSIDTGFIVFNDRTYPNFIRLLTELGVAYQKTEMSFSVRNDDIDLEYNGNNLNGLFSQRRNLFSPSFWGMLKDVVRFNRDVRLNDDPDRTIGQYLEQRSFSPVFRDNYLLPMISAIWSMGLDDSRNFPLRFFVRFFENHGLLNLLDRPQWYSICGGSRSYIVPLTQRFEKSIHLETAVREVVPCEKGILLRTQSDEAVFDGVIFACHADQALRILTQPTTEQGQVLGSIPFSDNEVVLHCDTSLLPRSQRAWASWNYRVHVQETEQPTLTYNMNILQQLQKQSTYLVTLNEAVREDKVIRRFNYSHPQYTQKAVVAQSRWGEISGVDHIHYCGAYWFNGFHEDGVRSAIKVCRALGVSP